MMNQRGAAFSRLRFRCCLAFIFTAQMLFMKTYLNDPSLVFLYEKILPTELAIPDNTSRGRQLDQFGSNNVTARATNHDIVEVTRDHFAVENSRHRPDVVVFYNIYVNDAQENISMLEETIFEQLQQIGMSHAARLGDLTLYYNTIGHILLLGESFTNNMQAQCKRLSLRCIHMEHHETGFEEITLQKAYEFCSAFPDRKIIYLHNKGSYNSGRWNIPWRRHMTRAVTSSECLENMNQCTTCGLLFQPIWTFFFPGNFFVSRCDYVNQLVPPKDFEEKINNMLELRPGAFMGLIFDEWESTLGRKRYSMEHWIGSHPSFVPCHLSTDSSIRTWTGDEGLPFSFMTAQQHALESKWFQAKLGRMEKILSDKPSRKREWFLLPGWLYKWYTLYQEYPPESSWIWDYFPDGREWQQSVFRDSNATAVLHEAWQKTPASVQWLEMVRAEMDRREKNRLALLAKAARTQRRRERQLDR